MVTWSSKASGLGVMIDFVLAPKTSVDLHGQCLNERAQIFCVFFCHELESI